MLTQAIMDYEPVSELVERGEKRGYVTTEELDGIVDISHVVPENIADLEEWLEESGIRVKESDSFVDDYDDDTEYVDGLKQYFREINEYPTLKAEEQIYLAELAQAGNTEAVSRLVSGNLKLAIRIAMRYRNSGVEMSDLIQQGNLGLYEAVKRFDPHKGFRFSTYAVFWVRKSITTYIFETQCSIRLPMYIGNNRKKVMDYRSDYYKEHGRYPRNAAVAEALGLSSWAVEAVLDSYNVVSMSAPIGTDDEQGTLEDVISNPDDRNVWYAPEKRDTENSLDKVMRKALTEREYEVLTLAYGLFGCDPWKLEAIGKRLGVSRQRVQQIKVKAEEKLRISGMFKKLFSAYVA